MKWWRWNLGRQNTGYEIFPFYIFSWSDAYLLRYTTGTGILPHIDPIKNKRHFRLNIVIWNAASGGKFNCEHMIFESKRIKLFRPDLNIHSVDPIKCGTRFVLSLGFALQ